MCVCVCVCMCTCACVCFCCIHNLYADDTGCPSSQSASPAKTPSGSENSPLCSPTLCERKAQTKRVRVDVMAEWSSPPTRHKREQRSSNRPRGESFLGSLSPQHWSSASQRFSLDTPILMLVELFGRVLVPRTLFSNVDV